MVMPNRPERAHLLDDVGREAVLVLELGGDRDDLAGDEPSDGVDDLLPHVVAGRCGSASGVCMMEKCTLW